MLDLRIVEKRAVVVNGGMPHACFCTNFNPVRRSFSHQGGD